MTDTNEPTDELLQSYVLRKLIISGERDFSSIITNNGSWRNCIILKDEKKHFIDSNKQHIFNIIRKQIEQSSFFHNPIYIKHLILKIFSDKNNQVNYIYKFVEDYECSKFSCNFCIDCIRGYIKKYGYGYFNIRWMTQKYCTVHNKKLLTLINNSSYKEYIRVLSGNLPDSIQFKENNQLDYTLEDNKLFNYYSTPCFLLEVEKWLRFYIRSYIKQEEIESSCDLEVWKQRCRSRATYKETEDDIISYAVHKINKKLNYSMYGIKKVNFKYVEKAFQALLKLKVKFVIQYLNSSFKIIKARIKTNLNDDVVFPMLVPINRNCKSCNLTQDICPFSRNIIMFQNPQKIEIENYCDRMNHNFRNNIYRKEHFSNSFNKLFKSVNSDELWYVKFKNIPIDFNGLDLYGIYNLDKNHIPL